MQNVEFDYSDVEKLSERMNEAADTKIKIGLNEGLRAIGRLFVPQKGTGPLADETPKRTGKLARSSFFQIQGGTQDQYLEIMQPARNEKGDFYGWFVREGTAPHIIKPVNKKALHWINNLGEEHFAMIVHHPGTQPNPYHKRVFDALRPQVQGIVNQIGEKITAYLSGK